MNHCGSVSPRRGRNCHRCNSGRMDAGTSGTWEGDYVDAGCALTITGLPTGPYNRVPTHSFTGGTGCSAALYSEYLNYCSSGGHFVSLKWSDPLGASGNDYDMFAFDGSFVVDYFVDRQNGNDHPYEWVVGYPGEYIWVTKWSGAARALRIDTNRARLVIATPRAVVGRRPSCAARRPPAPPLPRGRSPGRARNGA